MIKLTNIINIHSNGANAQITNNFNNVHIIINNDSTTATQIEAQEIEEQEREEQEIEQTTESKKRQHVWIYIKNILY